MKKNYIAVWYDLGLQIKKIEARNLPEAKHKAFQMICDSSGDKLISNIDVYEFRYSFKCHGEINPKGGLKEFAHRDYYTGMKIRRNGKDN